MAHRRSGEPRSEPAASVSIEPFQGSRWRLRRARHTMGFEHMTFAQKSSPDVQLRGVEAKVLHSLAQSPVDVIEATAIRNLTFVVDVTRRPIARSISRAASAAPAAYLKRRSS